MAVLRSLVTTLGLNAAQFRSELARSKSEFSGFGDTLVKSSKVVAGGVKTVIDQVFSLRSALIALGSGAALAGIKAAYNSLDQTAQLGRNIGIAAQQWHAYAQAAEWAGTSSERLADVVKDLNVKIADAAKTGGGPLADFFKQIGQSAQSWASLSPDEQLRRFTAELQKMSASDARFWLDELNDAAAELFDTLYTRNGELLTFADSIESMGMALTGGQFAAVRDARLELDRLVSVMGSLWQQVKASMAPAVAEGSRLIRTWITDSAEAKGGFAELGKGIALYVIDGVEQASRALQALMQWVDQTINKIEPLRNESTRAPYIQARVDLFAARVDYNEAEKAFIAASNDEGAAAPAFGHLAQMGEALSQAEERVKSFLNVGESNGWDGYFKNLELLRQKIATATTAGDGEAPLPAPGAARPVGVVAIPDAPKAPKVNSTAISAFKAESADIERELQHRQELLQNAQRAMEDVNNDGFDRRAAEIERRHGVDMIEEGRRYAESQRRLTDKFNAAQVAAAGDHDLTMSLQAERNKALEQLAQEHSLRIQTIDATTAAAKAEQARQAADIQMRLDRQVLDQKLNFATQALSIVEQSAEEGSALQRLAFLAGKGVAMAQTFVNTEAAAVAAMAPPPIGLGPIAGLGHAQTIRAIGYASMGLIAGQSIAGMFDKGGYIPANQFGIVSELGDEFVNGTLVRGPANVTSRRESEEILARAAGQGGGGGGVTVIQHISISGAGDNALTLALQQAASEGAEAGAKRGYQMVVEDVAGYGQIRRMLA
ncbi:hypothetical protein [Aeromonas caviae]